MKPFKIIGFTMAILISGLLVALFSIRNPRMPVYQGNLKLDGLSEPVEAYFTEYGIPHIYAQNDLDALFALGYIQAQDRLWQLDLVRHVGMGTLSELFGPDLVESDKYLRTFGLDQAARNDTEKLLNSGNQALINKCQAYVDGINAYIANNPKPLEHLILGVEVEPFTITNLLHVPAYMAFGFAVAAKTDPFLTLLRQQMDSAYLADLPIYHTPGQTVNKTYMTDLQQISNDFCSFGRQFPLPTFQGSNSWIVGPEKSATGNTILVNDPHIGFGQPSVWYEAHVVTPTTEVYGYFLPGLPFSPVMHTPTHGIGMTMFENDDIDFYLEKVSPIDSNQYQYKGEWEQMEIIEETINVKGGDPVRFNRRMTKHGPVISDVMEDVTETVSMFWVYTQVDGDLIEVVSEFPSATTPERAAQLMENFHAPGINIMYGNSNGDIAWWAAGKLIYRTDERTSKFFKPGHDGTADPDSVLDFSLNPRSVNPPEGFVYSANQQPDSVNGIYYSGYYTPDYRATTIERTLRNQEKWSTEDMKQFLLNSESELVNATKPIFMKAEMPDDFRVFLNEWNNQYSGKSGAGLFFVRWNFNVLKLAMQDELGDEQWTSFQEASHLFKRTLKHLALNEGSIWWDDVTTETKDKRSDIIQQAFDLTMEEISGKFGNDFNKWNWQEAHQLTHKHAMAANPLMGWLFNVGPYPIDGANEVINNLGQKMTDDLDFSPFMGPSTRRIVDFADVRNNSWSILPTGQSGNLFSPHYDDQAQMFANGEFRKMMMDEQEIKSSRKQLILSPEN